MKPLVTRRETDDDLLDKIAYIVAFPIVYFFAAEVLATPVLGDAMGTLRFVAIIAFSYLLIRAGLASLKPEPRAPLLLGVIGAWLAYGVTIVAALGWHISTHWGQLVGGEDVIGALVGWRPPLSDASGWLLFGPLVAAFILTRYLVQAESNKQALRDAVLFGGTGIVGPLLLFGAWILIRSHFAIPAELGLLKFVEFKGLAQSLSIASGIGAGTAWLYVLFDQLRDVIFEARRVPA